MVVVVHKKMEHILVTVDVLILIYCGSLAVQTTRDLSAVIREALRDGAVSRCEALVIGTQLLLSLPVLLVVNSVLFTIGARLLFP